MRRRFGVTVVAIRRGSLVTANLEGGERVQEGDVLITIGSEDAIRRLAVLV